MYTNKHAASSNRVLVTTLTTLGWLGWMLAWLALAWRHYTFLQNLASLGISTLVFVACVGVMWIGHLGSKLTATLLATLGWWGFVLYWIGFAGRRYGLLQNGAVLLVAGLLWLSAVVIFWLAGPTGETC